MVPFANVPGIAFIGNCVPVGGIGSQYHIHFIIIRETQNEIPAVLLFTRPLLASILKLVPGSAFSLPQNSIVKSPASAVFTALPGMNILDAPATFKYTAAVRSIPRVIQYFAIGDQLAKNSHIIEQACIMIIIKIAANDKVSRR